MNTSRLLASLLLAAPALAQAAPHTITVVMSNGRSASYAHTSKAAMGEQVNYIGKSGGKNVINNMVLGGQTGGKSFSLEYQLEVGGGGQTFQAQSSLDIHPGETIRAVQCGDWKVDVSLDAVGGKAAPSSAPAGANQSLTTSVGKRTCKVIARGDTQSNIVDGAGKSAFILNAVVPTISRGASNVQYQLQSSPLMAQGETALTVGKKTSAQGGKVSFLLEGAAATAAAEAPAAPAAPTRRDEGGPIPLR